MVVVNFFKDFSILHLLRTNPRLNASRYITKLTYKEHNRSFSARNKRHEAAQLIAAPFQNSGGSKHVLPNPRLNASR